jgi:hypothetical protein
MANEAGAKAQVRIRVEFLEAYENRRQVVTLAGPEDRGLIEALEAAVGKSPHNRIYALELVPEHLGDDLLALDTRITLGDLAHLFGDDVVKIDNAGRGGGAEPVASLFDVLGEFAKGSRIAKSVSDAIGNVRWREYRLAAKEWDDRGELPRELVDLILNDGEWMVDHFDRAFLLPRNQGRALLRDLGYDRRDDPDLGEVWWRRYPDREPPTVPPLPR